MSPQTASDFVRSINDRLENEARGRGRPFVEVLELFAIERFLHRLGRSAQRDRFVLKGALLLRRWLGADTRPTRDIDLLGPVDVDADQLRAHLAEILAREVEEDGNRFRPETIAVAPIRIESPVAGLRAKFDANLGRTRLRSQVDVGLGDSVYPPAEEIVPGGLLGSPVASVRACTPYTTVAEKLEAMVVLGEANSRIKDYYDLAFLPRALAFEGETLVETIQRTFARRATAIPPRRACWTLGCVCERAGERDPLEGIPREGRAAADGSARPPGDRARDPELCRAGARRRARRTAFRPSLVARSAVAVNQGSGHRTGSAGPARSTIPTRRAASLRRTAPAR